MTNLLPFKGNKKLTMGVELELQLVNLKDFDLTMEAEDFLRRVYQAKFTGEIKPEITQSMIEINSSIHDSYASLLAELLNLRNILAIQAYKAHIAICGGGAHPFQKWKKQRIFPKERYITSSEQYGFLTKQFTVFGQHIHIACRNGDDALYLCHALAPYIPHFIALSASSPFQQGTDTSFDCSRLTIVNSFPLSGTPPFLFHWIEFEAYFEKMKRFGAVKSMKDFYWDVRPKPEFGTIELRICDTPLRVEKAADIAAYAQLLVCWLMDNRVEISEDIYLTYAMNRFYATRYGLEAILIDPVSEVKKELATDILSTCEQLDSYADNLKCSDALENIRRAAISRENDASWLRRAYAKLDTFSDTVRVQTELWRKTFTTF